MDTCICSRFEGVVTHAAKFHLAGEGKFIDVLMVLSVLTSVATEIDEFAVEWLSDRTAPTDAEHSDLPDVRVDLKFRLYVREPSAPTVSVRLCGRIPHWTLNPRGPGRWQRISALLSNASEHSVNCQS